MERLAPLAEAGVPIFHLHGDMDKVVPLEENSGLVKERYDKLGGEMTLELIAGGGHDMKAHWFESRELVDFVSDCLRSSLRGERLKDQREKLLEEAIEKVK